MNTISHEHQLCFPYVRAGMSRWCMMQRIYHSLFYNIYIPCSIVQALLECNPFLELDRVL